METPKGKYAWTATVGEKGQIVIPKQARQVFNIKPGDTILLLGDEIARSLGLRVEIARLLLTAVAALLAASAVSVVGLLGFVGLIVPHAARLLIGSDYRFLLPAAALLGVAVVTLSDTFARTAFAPVELPVGILMAVLGAPFFLFLLRREL